MLDFFLVLSYKLFMPKIKVVHIIPTYKEKENILLMLKTLKQINKSLPQYQFSTIIVDDNSPDGTGEVVKKWQVQDPSTHLLTGPKKGLGVAMLRGFQYALNRLKADIIIPNDCDFSWDPYKIPQMLTKIEEGYDVVVASRHAKGGNQRGWSKLRKVNHWLSNYFFARVVAGIKEVTDYNGTYKAIRVKGVLDQLPLHQLPSRVWVQGFAFQPYLVYELSKVTQKFIEVPMTFKFRTRGEAKISPKYYKTYLRDAGEYIILCLYIRLQRWKEYLV